MVNLHSQTSAFNKLKWHEQQELHKKTHYLTYYITYAQMSFPVLNGWQQDLKG